MLNMGHSAAQLSLQRLQMGMVYLQEIGDVPGLEKLRTELDELLHDAACKEQEEMILNQVNALESMMDTYRVEVDFAESRARR